MPEREALHDERWELLEQLDELFEKPLIALSFVWLILLIIDFTSGLSPLLQTLTYVIWALFILDFLIEIIIAPNKARYLRRNWLTAVALLLPALRVLRIFRAFRVLRAARGIRSVNLVRLVTSLNRGMRAVRRTMEQRGVGYVVALTVVVTFAGAAGMYFFEGPQGLATEPDTVGEGLTSYGDALWFTVMLMTTIASDYWPQTPEGRMLTLLLSLYAFAVFGYIAGTIASFFIESEASARAKEAETGLETEVVASLQTEITALREQLASLTTLLESQAERGSGA